MVPCVSHSFTKKVSRRSCTAEQVSLLKRNNCVKALEHSRILMEILGGNAIVDECVVHQTREHAVQLGVVCFRLKFHKVLNLLAIILRRERRHRPLRSKYLDGTLVALPADADTRNGVRRTPTRNGHGLRVGRNEQDIDDLALGIDQINSRAIGVDDLSARRQLVVCLEIDHASVVQRSRGGVRADSDDEDRKRLEHIWVWVSR